MINSVISIIFLYYYCSFIQFILLLRMSDVSSPSQPVLCQVSKVNVNLYSTQIRHVSNKGSTCYLPPTQEHPNRKASPSFGWYSCAYPGRDGQTELTWVTSYILR